MFHVDVHEIVKRCFDVCIGTGSKARIKPNSRNNRNQNRRVPGGSGGAGGSGGEASGDQALAFSSEYCSERFISAAYMYVITSALNVDDTCNYWSNRLVLS